MALHDIVARLGRSEALDPVAEPLGAVTRAVTASRPVKDLLSGTWLGHSLHPVLTDVPIGCYTSALALDLLGGERSRDSADLLVALGILATVPTALAGLSDWSDTSGEDRRIGVVHAAANSAATVMYVASLAARRAGGRGLGVALSMAGLGIATASAYLGGHLVFARGVTVDRTAWEEGSADWVRVASAEQVPEGKPTAVTAGDVRVLLYRRNGRVFAVSNTCSHMGGPLDEGEVDDDRLQVSCPWHASVFRLEDGSVVHGPATLPQPAWDARATGDGVEVRRRPQP